VQLFGYISGDARVHGPWTRAVNSGSGNRPLQVVRCSSFTRQSIIIFARSSDTYSRGKTTKHNHVRLISIWLMADHDNRHNNLQPVPKPDPTVSVPTENNNNSSSVATMTINYSLQRMPVVKRFLALCPSWITWPVSKGVKITTYLESPTPHCLFTI